MPNCPYNCGLTSGCGGCRPVSTPPSVGELQIGHFVGDACPGGHQEEAERGFKFDTGKLRYDLVPPQALRELTQVYTDGAAKYGDENYMKGMSWKRVIASLLRHVEAYRAGEDTDKESGSPHLAHAAWCCFTLMTYAHHGLGEDDRNSSSIVTTRWFDGSFQS